MPAQSFTAPAKALDRIDLDAVSFFRRVLWRHDGAHPLVHEALDHIRPENGLTELFLLNKIQGL